MKVLGGDPTPRRLRALVAAPVDVEITRLDERTIRVGIAGGMFAGILGHLFRSPDYPFGVGDAVELGGMTIEVIEVTDDLGPSELLVRFDRDLEDTSLRWVRWDDGRYSPFVPSAVGDSIRLPAPIGPF